MVPLGQGAQAVRPSSVVTSPPGHVEGDFKDGEREGKGNKYYMNGNKLYEGEYKKDTANGKGIQYYENGEKKYEGELKEGDFNGKGIFYQNHGGRQIEKYDGNFVNGKKEGEFQVTTIVTSTFRNDRRI